uniref:Uncharacterized protein n=1 Tax=Piliocolobus tephrosceles TaxID=591936 RepID=A0A8C9GK03_9PRIM
MTGAAPPVGGVLYKGSSRPGRHTAPCRGLGAPYCFPAVLRLESRQRGEAEPPELRRAVPPGGRGHERGSGSLTFCAPPAGNEGKMSVSGFKAKLKLLASVFHKNQETPQLTLHCNIMMRRPFVFKEKLTMKTESLTEEKLECSLWCCLSDPSPRGRRCVLERCIVPWMRQVKSPVQVLCPLFLSGFCISCFSPVEWAPDSHPLTLPNLSLHV